MKKTNWFHDFIQLLKVDFIDANRLYIDKNKKNNGSNNAVSQVSQDISGKIGIIHQDQYHLTMYQQSQFPNKILDLISQESEIDLDSVIKKINEILYFDSKYNKNKIFGDLGFNYDLISKIKKTNQGFHLVLNEHLDDIIGRIELSKPLARKINKFVECVNSLLMYKKIEYDNEKGLIVRSNKNNNHFYHLEELSSGEQHIIILFARLIFDSEEGSLVFIDEPEISLHAAWQKQLMKLLIDIAHDNKFFVVIATHSFLLINGEWDKTIELAEIRQ